MTVLYTIMLVSIVLATIYFLARAFRQDAQAGKRTKLGLPILVGMLAGGACGVLIFFNLDTTKGWNPFGWWFPASFLLAIFGGITVPLVYAAVKRRKHSDG
jgi:hypothetical protein